MTLSVHAVRARTPWGAGTFIPDEAQKETAPKQDVPYRCAKGCEFTVPFAAEVVPPDDWDCRCGQSARREGAPEGAPGRPELPGLISGTGRHARSHVSEGTRPWQQLMKNVVLREPGHADTALAEAMERARQARGAQS